MEHRLEFLKCDLWEEAAEGLGEGICFAKLPVPQRILRTAEKKERKKSRD
jgi:hypothetical protein